MHFCGMFDELAFLPVDEVKDGLQYLLEIASDDANNLLDYLNSAHVNGRFHTISRPATSQGLISQVRFRRIPPRYSPKLWSRDSGIIKMDN